jgi:ribosomal protein S30
MDIQPYKSLRTAIAEASAKPIEKNPRTWKTAGGCWGARCKESGNTLYFDSQENANAWLDKKFQPAGVVTGADTSTPVQLDREGYEVLADGTPANGNDGGRASKAKAATADPKRKAQPKSGKADTGTKKESVDMGFGKASASKVVQSLHEAGKIRFKKPKIAAPEDTNNDPRFAKAAQPLARRKSDRFGNPVKKKAGFGASARAMQSNMATADDLLRLVDAKPVGTTFEIYGKKGGQEVVKKVKKMMRYGEVVFVMGTTVVELVKSGAGLQVVNAANRKILLDGGNDMIWESADHTDAGWITISE